MNDRQRVIEELRQAIGGVGVRLGRSFWTTAAQRSRWTGW